MGVGYDIVCRDCGMSKTLVLGLGYMNPCCFKDGIRDGKYGSEAKRLIMEHEDWYQWVEWQPFHCSCGYITDRPVAVFNSPEGQIRTDRFRCYRCGKRMEEGFGRKRRCWKCGGKLEIRESHTCYD